MILRAIWIVPDSLKLSDKTHQRKSIFNLNIDNKKIKAKTEYRAIFLHNLQQSHVERKLKLESDF